jgi:hypothetical protein
MASSWTLSGLVTRVNRGVGQKGRTYQMLQVGGFTFWLEPEHFDGYVEGEPVVIEGTHIRDVRTATGFEPVHVIDKIERVNVTIPRVEHPEKGKPM